MVFENLTLVELHLDDSRSESESSGWGSRRSADEGTDRDDEGGRSLRGPMMLLVLLAAGAALMVRRRRKGKSGEEESSGEQISIEQATEHEQ